MVAEKSVDNVTFRRYVATLREKCPIGEGREVSVRRRKGVFLHHHVSHGYTLIETSEDGKTKILTIVIDEGNTKAETIDTLIHEWAHAMCGDDLSHSESWGVAYSKCYRAFHDCA